MQTVQGLFQLLAGVIQLVPFSHPWLTGQFCLGDAPCSRNIFYIIGFNRESQCQAVKSFKTSILYFMNFKVEKSMKMNHLCCKTKAVTRDLEKMLAECYVVTTRASLHNSGLGFSPRCYPQNQNREMISSLLLNNFWGFSFNPP